MRRTVQVLMFSVVVIPLAASPVAAQAAGSADARAAKRVDPNWKAPRTP